MLIEQAAAGAYILSPVSLVCMETFAMKPAISAALFAFLLAAPAQADLIGVASYDVTRSAGAVHWRPDRSLQSKDARIALAELKRRLGAWREDVAVASSPPEFVARDDEVRVLPPELEGYVVCAVFAAAPTRFERPSTCGVAVDARGIVQSLPRRAAISRPVHRHDLDGWRSLQRLGEPASCRNRIDVIAVRPHLAGSCACLPGSESGRWAVGLPGRAIYPPADARCR